MWLLWYVPGVSHQRSCRRRHPWPRRDKKTMCCDGSNLEPGGANLPGRRGGVSGRPRNRRDGRCRVSCPRTCPGSWARGPPRWPSRRPHRRILCSNHSRWGFFNQFGEFSSLAKFVGGSQEVASPFGSAARYLRPYMPHSFIIVEGLGRVGVQNMHPPSANICLPSGKSKQT